MPGPGIQSTGSEMFSSPALQVCGSSSSRGPVMPPPRSRRHVGVFSTHSQSVRHQRLRPRACELRHTGQIPPPALVQPGSCTKNFSGFYMFKWLEKIKKRRLLGGTSKLCKMQISVFINCPSGTRHLVHLLSIVCGCFRTRRAELNRFEREHMAPTSEIFTIWSFAEKCVNLAPAPGAELE